MGQIAKTGITLPGGNIAEQSASLAGLADAFNRIQEEGTIAGLSIEESFNIATQAARAFNLKGGSETLGFFEKLRVLSEKSGMHMRDFSAGLGDMMGLAAKYGDQIGESFAGMSATIARSLGGGVTEKTVGQSVARDLADTPLMARMALHMKATGKNWEQVATDFEKGQSSPEGTLNDVMKTLQMSGVKGNTAGGRLQMLLGMQGLGTLKPAEVDALVTRPKFLEDFKKGMDPKSIMSEVDKSLRDHPATPTTALEYMGAQQGALEQLVGIARALLMWLTGSFFAGMVGNEAGRMQAVRAAGGGVNVPVNTRGAKAH